MTRLAFFFDSSACTGCKACQAACKDKHALPAGVLWRRVYDVSGGGWARRDDAWVSNVFAYNLSISCNHCDRPICLEVCPAGAYSKRADGIVLLDEDWCLGCQYCTWACPYGAPQYDARSGHTSKCDLCADNVDAGLPPACVAACPLRALEYGDRGGLEADPGSPGPYPLPEPGITGPSLVVIPHREAARAAHETAFIANREEVEPRAGRRGHEWALVLFTLLAQAAVGAFWTLGALSLPAAAGNPAGGSSPNSPGWSLIALLMLAALAVSLLHLGRPLMAWRALANLKRSWLSREILFAILFTATCAVLAAVQWFGGISLALRTSLWALGVAFGFLLVFAMSRAYLLPTIHEWNKWTTPASFFLTTVLLGGLGGILLSSAADLYLLPVSVALFICAFAALLARVRFYRSRLPVGL